MRVIVDQIRETETWFAERRAQLRVKGGIQRGDNIVVSISRALVGALEATVAKVVVAFQDAASYAALAVAQAAVSQTNIRAVGQALALVRAALAEVHGSAETGRQKALAERCRRYEHEWRRAEDALNRIEEMGQSS